MQLIDLIPDPDELIPYQYENIRSPEFDKIINKYLSSAPSVENPVIIHMAGIPCAGKTTFYHNNNWGKHVFIAFDHIMEDISGYQKTLREQGTKEAFRQYEIPARIIGYELLRRAVEEHKSIFLDNGGSSKGHLHLMQNIKNFGYKTHMYYIFCTLETAVARSVAREKEINRHIPIETIKDRYIKTLQNVEKYKKIVDEFYQIDSNNNINTNVA